MGANCCIAAKQRPQPCVIPVEVSAYRNIRHSPSWSFRWDNRTHIEDIMEIPTYFSNHSSGSIRPETKSGSIAPTEGFSNGSSPSDLLHKVKWHKSEKKMETSKVAQPDTRGGVGQLSRLTRDGLDVVECPWGFVILGESVKYHDEAVINVARCFCSDRHGLSLAAGRFRRPAHR